MSCPYLNYHSRIIDQDFGNCLSTEDLILPLFNCYGRNYFRPWQRIAQNAKQNMGSMIINEKDKFQVTLDVQQFKPNEIIVKVVNNEVLIEGKHEERKDEHGYISRQFTRRYSLPKGCCSEDVCSNLSSDGILTVTANKKCIEGITNERSVPIQFIESTIGRKTQANQTTEKKECDKVCAEQKCKDTKLEECKKKDCQIMLKEDHSRLLKPEFTKPIPESTDKKEQCTMAAKTDAVDIACGMKTKEMAGSSMSAAATQEKESISAATTEKSSFSSSAMSSETIKSQETSSFMSSMSATIKEMSENTQILSDIISAELKEAAENL